MPAIANGTKVVGSPQQEAFWEELVYGTSHILLEARAGTGKSFSCREGMRRTKGSRLYCAFNKHIATEFGQDLPNGCRAATMHSLGYAACRDAFKGIQIDDRKTSNLIKQIVGTKIPYDARVGLERLVSLCKGETITGRGRSQLLDLVVRHDIQLGTGEDLEAALDCLPTILNACAEDTTRADFDDMIWLPVIHRLTPRPADILFVDEAQDLNTCQQKLALALCPKGRIVIVGDRYQSIYGFRGADVDSIPNMERILSATERGLKTLPLTVTRRCPTMVVEMARMLVHDLEPMPDAPEGSIDVSGTERAIDAMSDGDMVLCRTNAPLVGAAFRLIRNGKKASIKGRDFGTALVKFIRGLGASTIPELCKEVEEHRAREVERLVAMKAKPETLVTLSDKCDCVNELASVCKSVAEVITKVETLFSEDSGDGVILSSVHRAKGLEADHVFILRPELLPHPSADKDWEVQQERNICYVAVTRSKHKLTFVGPIPSTFGGW